MRLLMIRISPKVLVSMHRISSVYKGDDGKLMVCMDTANEFEVSKDFEDAFWNAIEVKA